MRTDRPRILLIAYDNDSHIGFFPMGLAALAAYGHRAGFDVTIYSQDLHHYPDEHLTAHLDAHAYDVVGLSFIGAYYPYQKAKAISRAIHAAKRRPFYVIGGHGPSPEPAYFLDLLGADAVVLGEGEETFVELVEALGRGDGFEGVPGLAYRTNGKVHVNQRRAPIRALDALPMPAYERFPVTTYKRRRDAAHVPPIGNRFSMQLLSGRGCKFKCNFCYRLDPGMRLRAPEAILDEMGYLFRQWDITHFMFYDDLMMASEERTVELCEAFIQSGPPDMTFTCQGRLNYATPAALDAMKRAGCAYIYYGVESYNDDILNAMGKALTTETIRRGVENTRAAGIRFSPNVIFGNIGETREHLQNSVDFLLEYDDCAQLRAIKPVTPYPGSPLYDHAIERGLLEGPEDFYERKHTNTDLLTVNFTPMSDDEFYDALAAANAQVVDHYCSEQRQGYHQLLKRLYGDKDASFRGFRHT
jgi:radical SAM superfamily enzyme YgiQ (UPF0313 family)